MLQRAKEPLDEVSFFVQPSVVKKKTPPKITPPPLSVIFQELDLVP